MSALLARARAVVLPAWVQWAAIALLALAAYGLGRVHEARRAADAPVRETVRIAKAQERVVVKTEVVYRDRIQKIYVEGKTLDVQIPNYIKPADDSVFAVPVGLIRVLDAAWTGQPVGPTADTDREPAAVPVSELGRIEAGNATSCRAWREQALGWRKFYAGQQVAVNGKAGEWAQGLAGTEE